MRLSDAMISGRTFARFINIALEGRQNLESMSIALAEERASTGRHGSTSASFGRRFLAFLF
jgi:hypothetical protein